MDYLSPQHAELLNVMNKINHQILCILLDYTYIHHEIFKTPVRDSKESVLCSSTESEQPRRVTDCETQNGSKYPSTDSFPQQNSPSGIYNKKKHFNMPPFGIKLFFLHITQLQR